MAQNERRGKSNFVKFQSDVIETFVFSFAQIIALKATVTHQDSTIKQLHKVRKEIEEVFRKEKKLLEIQIEQDQNTIKQLELRVDIGRKTVQEAKTAQAYAERDLVQVNYDRYQS